MNISSSPTTSSVIARPEDLTPTLQRTVLERLRYALASLQSGQTVVHQGVLKMRIRGWEFLYEDGEPIVDIILDKGYSPSTGDGSLPVPDTALSLEECTEVHKSLLNTDALDLIDDNVSVRVGSPGETPLLQDAVDYKAALGSEIQVKTWTPVGKATILTGIVLEVVEDAGTNGFVLESQCGEKFQISFDVVRCAHVISPPPAAKKSSRSRRKKESHSSSR